MIRRKRKTTQRGLRNVRVGYFDERGHRYTFWSPRELVPLWEQACEFRTLSPAECGYPLGYGRTA
jgi:hypothetical protein